MAQIDPSNPDSQPRIAQTHVRGTPISARKLSSSVRSYSDLRAGLYLALPLDRKAQESVPERAYIFFWPEDSTWDDKAISSVRRNRVTFMRYLTKLTDQIIALVSPEQADAMVWTTSKRDTNDPSIPSEIFDESRMFSFEVERSTEQKEDAIASRGFMLQPDAQKASTFVDALQICLVPGEEKAGLLAASFEPSRTTSHPYESHPYTTALRSIIRGENLPIMLGELTVTQLKILGDHGLQGAYPLPFTYYAKRMSLEEADRQSEYENSMQAMKEGIKQDKTRLKDLIKPMVRHHFSNVYPSLGIGVHMPESDCERILAKYPGLAKVPRGIEANPSAGAIDDAEFKDLKYAWHTIRDFLRQEPTPPEGRQMEFVKEILGGASGGEWTVVTKGKGNKRSLKSAFIQSAKNAVASFFGYETKPPTQLLPDPEFIQSLQHLADEFPVVSEVTDRITTRLQTYLAKLGNKLVKKYLDKVTNEEESRLKNLIEAERTNRFQAESEVAGLALLNDLRSLMPSNPSNSLFIEFVAEESGYGPQRFTIRGRRTAEHRPHELFTIYPLELTEHDAQQCRTNEQHVPEPKLSNRQFFVFSLYEGFKIKFVQLIRDKCLVIVAGPKQFDLYLDDNVRLRGAIEHGVPKRFLKYDRLVDPSQCIFAFDEKTRLLAFFHNTILKGPELSLFGFDETFSNIQARGSPFSLKEWYDSEVHIDKICFVSGSEEVCLIESSGRARVLSLVTLNFRPASVQIPGQVVDAFSAPDGSCLLVSILPEGKSVSTPEDKLLVYHWASFGSTQSGINPAVLPPSSTGRIVTSFEGRNRVHLVSFSNSTMAATSVAISIKQKATEFSFRSNQADSTKSITETVNNCLIDCHRDVWTRFPVAPAVSRSTLSSLGREPRELVVASTSNLQPVDNYFTRMITKFERTTCKPISAELRTISVVATSDPPNILVQRMPCSKYPLGSFVVEFICLIPLHLAITRDNRFIPLKDGIWDPEYERSLLGADVPTIINSLSIGWYESLFQSYMATKPVRVVSSMGEQSVDTTFAGSAMRTTEGVWLSCTPTHDYLLVSLDFEGVHSIERSAQEDALLVLFNTAISNLVLFRNNFALSRDIAGLFQSFQSSAMVLDPESNPSLFNSTLAIIIKDVTDSDSRDIVKEFSLKFQRIVQKEQEQNFITRLHRGRVQIIPWPVINSSSFYTLFHHLRRYLDAQPITHPSGGVFLHNMKTLMAKIKASDWGSLDQNQATHRARQLDGGLHNALGQGSSDEADTQSPLKNLDTDEEVLTEGPNVAFFIPDISGVIVQDDEVKMGKALDALVTFCLTNSNIGPRHIAGERVYVELLQNQLYGLLDQRLEHVRRWIKVNVQRFPSLVHLATIFVLARTDIQGAMNVALHTTVRSRAKSLGNIPNQLDADCLLVIAHSICATSKLIHAGTTATLSKKLDVPGRVSSLCTTKMNTCAPRACILVARHVVWRTQIPDTDASDVVTYRGTSRTRATAVIIPIHVLSNAFSVDACATSPITSMGWTPARFTSVANRTVVRALALQGGFVGLIETQPSAVEEQFSGRHETFQYTRYAQVEQRLTCVILIPPGELRHAGEHTHTTDEKAFHYCNIRCPSCQYLCTLPLGHPQQLHETSHGSMTTTQWAIQGTNQDARYELNGRNFGIGDEGAPMLCHLVCSAQGRHAHIDFCREPDNCRGGAELEHINERMHPEPHRPKDWISHRLTWARSGFQDPYSREQQAEFAKCDVMCSGPEHNATATTAANPSYCNLPIFHPPQNRRAVPANGYVSADGHYFGCVNPARLQQAYHVIFVIDSSGSMDSRDRTPLPNTPVSQLLKTRCNNRYGAVLSALHGFWLSREAGHTTGQPRQDAYSVITFNNHPTTRLANDFTSTTDRLLSQLLQTSASGGTNFNLALAHAQTLIRTHWNSDKAPVLVFLSDGQCGLNQNTVYDLCRSSVQLGKPLAFYSVSFGPENSSAPLREMVQIAREVYMAAPRGTAGNIQGDPCAYYNAVDSIQLASTFLGISNSLHKPRASLIGQSSGRRAL
ncbi:unnamed protein product [Rhizoctonia solani]|uniref:VWFA domain-containing protein n=1 Tax=Rhizoctonia solani TaxID=456999 RepID=A0A8H2WZ85_9AGAM|nr:unnamed protein product [Rhizoctonia solani]